MSPRPTIRDVAAASGVSVTTVSHVLNEVSTARVSGGTRVRVLAAAAELGYTASRLAQGLRTQRSHLLALVSDTIAASPHAGKIIQGAKDVASSRGWTLIVFDTGGDPATEADDLARLQTHQVDGVLYASMYHRVLTVPGALEGLPVVLVDARTKNHGPPAVVPDEVAGGRAATEELLRYGHRRIGLPWNVDDIPATRGRLEGHRQAMRAAGLDSKDSLVIPENSESDGGYRASRALLTRDAPPTALFCFNDRMAMGAYRAAQELGLRVPHDVSVVGFDDQTYIAEGLYPGLTTVALPHLEMGTWAAERLLGLIEAGGPGPTEEATYLPCPLVPRASVAAPSRRGRT